MMGEEDASGSTATVIFIGNEKLLISHIGDSCVVGNFCFLKKPFSLALDFC